MSIEFKHQPVMAKEILDFFDHAQDLTLVDATAGGGGHLRLLAEAVGPHGRVIAFDRDPRAHREDAAFGVAQHYSDRVTLIHKPFSLIKESLQELHIDEVNGLICDLGVSSNQLDDNARGFSFLSDGPIDMRMDPTSGISAYEWLSINDERTIADTIFMWSGERKSRAIARKIKSSWPIENSTQALAQLILSAIKQRSWSQSHPATRSFMAIRMAVNNEMGELEKLIKDLPSILSINGIAAFLSFHSVEDRLVKWGFRGLVDKNCKILTKKPLTPSDEEIKINRRARSAKLRAIQRTA